MDLYHIRPDLTTVNVAFGYQLRDGAGVEGTGYHVELVVCCLSRDGKTKSKDDFYHDRRLRNDNGSVICVTSPDRRCLQDDVAVQIIPDKLDSGVRDVRFFLIISQAKERSHSFDNIHSVYMRLYDHRVVSAAQVFF